MSRLLKTFTRIPLAFLYPVARLIDFVTFHLLHWRREYTERDIGNAFPERGATERAEILRQSYRNAADTLVEAFWGFGASAEVLKQRVLFENPEVIKLRADAGQSVVLLTAHYGNWEWLLLAAGVQFGIPIDVLYQPQRIAAVDTFLREARGRFGGNLIPRKEFIFALMTAGNARVYALIADQTPRPEDPKLWTRFLQQDTAFFVGAGKVARFLDAQVVYVDMQRVRRGYYTVRFKVLAEPPYADGEDALIVQRYAAELEQGIRASPADWLWLQKKWKYAKPPVDRATEPGLAARE